MRVPVNGITFENGKFTFHLGANAASDDWIRAARLRKEGKEEELQAMEAEATYIETNEPGR